MNQWKGSLYLMALSYKREFLIFWLINSSFLLNIAICYMFPDITLITVGIIGAYIFTLILSTKLLNKTLSISLRYGLNRKRFLGSTAIFIVIWSFSHAIMMFLMNTILLWSADIFGLSNMIVPQLSMLFSDNVSLFINLLIDACVISLLSVIGILVNILFYRFGLIGGYGFVGLVAIILFIGVPFQWYIPLAEAVMSLNLAQFIGLLILLAGLVYGLIGLLTNKISTISASV
ncbi:MAG: hypothetical protein NAG76_02895 [Candidatus Pristimantibacillus lignocellulolyticus]|uniref:Uncharacterized protein n=1 Tax=Candidatus Pristimantibacillus lignocellulolyticus TaxID=2994561 RepID=A0A9J6ZH78_9BACL|nr:MAG: hypothetical protein NAG76_02895 [Candidatus Pristimantibacillus lignocellulolyticus]